MITGKWYFEVEIREPRPTPASQRDDGQHDGAHVRLGWARRSGAREVSVGR